MNEKKIQEARKQILKELNKILIFLMEEGMSDKEIDGKYREFLGNVGVVLSTLCLAISMEDERKMSEVIGAFNLESIHKSLKISTEEINDEFIQNTITRLTGNKYDLN